MSKLIFGLLVAVVALSLATAAFGLEVPLTYERHRGKSFRPGGSATLKSSLDRPAGEWKLPEMNSKQPIYAFAELGEKKRLLVLDRQKADDFFYSRLYFDSNGNGDLTDDPVVDGGFGLGEDQFCHAEFPIIDTVIEVAGRPVPYSFQTGALYSYFEEDGRPDRRLSKEHVDQNLNLFVTANCSYVGEFELDGQRYRVALGDGNANGRFNDQFSGPQDGLPREPIVLLLSGDSFYVASGRRIEPYDAHPLGGLLFVNGGLFDVNISTSEGKMTLTPVSESLVALKLAMATETMTLYTEDRSCCVMMYRPGTEVRVPQGKYRLLLYTARRKDEQGDEWLLAAQATTESPSVTVDPSSDAVLNFGEPYVPTVQVPEWSRQAVREGDSEVPLAFLVMGAGDELLAEFRRISGDRTRVPLSEVKENRDRPKEPTYTIVKADGEIVAQGSFEYG